MKLELRYLTTTTTTKANELRGIAVPYDQLSHPIPGVGRSFREKMKPGALSYDENTVLMTQHDQTGVPLARVGAGTLAFTRNERRTRVHRHTPRGTRRHTRSPRAR